MTSKVTAFSLKRQSILHKSSAFHLEPRFSATAAMSASELELRVTAKLGEGSFADVFKAKCAHTDQQFAVKRLKKRYRTLDEVSRLPEVQALQALQGLPNVVTLVDVNYDPAAGCVAIVFELLDCNVYELISERHRPVDEITALLLTYQLLSAVSFMHARGLFHRDIKPENCMVNKDTMVLKLVDFGSTRGASGAGPYTEYVSTRWYRAPECILTSGSYGPAVDEWAVGCMLYEMLTAKPLFPGKNELDQIARIHNLLGTPSRQLIQQFKQNPNSQIQFKFAQRSGQDLRKVLPMASRVTVELLRGLLRYNPQDRISAAEALQLECFGPFREAEAAWAHTDRAIAFPVFFFERPAEPVEPAPVEEQAIAEFVFAAPREALPEPPEPAVEIAEALLTPAPIPEPMPIPAPIPEPIAAPMPVPRPAPVPVQDSHLRAAPRVKAYQDALRTNKGKKGLPFHGAAFQFAVSKHTVYQRPRPEIVQPRVPRFLI
jgi:renal tumor antigen